MLDTAETEERARHYEYKYRNPDTTTRFVYIHWPHPL